MNEEEVRSIVRSEMRREKIRNNFDDLLGEPSRRYVRRLDGSAGRTPDRVPAESERINMHERSRRLDDNERIPGEKLVEIPKRKWWQVF